MSKLCSKCGAKLPNNAEFCPNCGQKFAAPENAASKRASKKGKNSKSKKQKSSRGGLLGVLIAVFIIGIITLAVLFAISYFDNNDDLSTDNENLGEIFYYATEEEHISAVSELIYVADNEMLLVVDESASYEDIQELAESYQAEIVGWIEQTGDYQLLLTGVYTEEELNDIANELEEDSKVVSAYPNYIFSLDDTSISGRGGFLYGEEWEEDLQSITDCEGKSWGIEAIRALYAWEFLTLYEDNVEPVRVGLIDSMFDDDHEDLGFAEVFYNTVGKTTTLDSHGTHVAGTMAAKANNEEGICGVYPYGDGNLYGVSVEGMRKYSENTVGSSVMQIKIACSELILRNVKVINYSRAFNYKGASIAYGSVQWDNQVNYMEAYAYILGDFLNRLLEKGYDFVLVNSAGNSGNAYDSKYASWISVIDRSQYSEVYDRIIVVGAVDSNFNICSFSNGGDRVDIYAPGDTIFSTVFNDEYENTSWSGTSMAAPHVSGVAAMVWSINSDLTGAEVKEIVCRYGNPNCTSCVDAYAAVVVAWYTSGSGSAQQADYGGILCWVVDASDESIAIAGAVVTATNLETGEIETTQTDEYGHFELFLPTGSYTLSVQADGYEDYTWRDDSLTVVEVLAGGVNYLDDWIKLTSSTYVPSDAIEYNGHYYYLVVDDEVTWTEAEALCESLGGYLATITSEEEQAFIYEISSGQNLWIGGYREDDETVWMWVTGETWSYTNWDSGEPNNSSNVVSNENRIVLWNDGYWNDLNDENTSESGGYICEWGDYTVTYQSGDDTVSTYIPSYAVEYNGHYYCVFEDSSIATWDDAVAFCEGLGGYLATITSDEENSFLYNYITGKGYTGAYFGLTDSETEGAWVWQNGESVSYTNWANDEPNNMYDNGEDYAMFYYKYTDGTWNDGDFDEETGGGKAFICEWGEYTNAAVSETESLFEILPSTFTFTSGAVWETTITLNDDGTFTGEYFAGYASASLEDGTVLSGGQQYLCNFSGKFSEPEYVSEYIYSMKLEYIDIEVEPGTEYVENDTLYTYTDPYGFDDADEFLIYLPGCPLDEVKEEFLSWTDISTENRTTMPTGVYGIYNINGEEGFVADDNSSIYHKSYSYSYNSYSSFLSSNFYSKGYLSFKPDSGASIINLIFDWGDENEREFAASDYNGTGDYIISLDFNEDYTSVMITVQSLSGYSLELWGGTSDGTLIAEYSLES